MSRRLEPGRTLDSNLSILMGDVGFLNGLFITRVSVYSSPETVEVENSHRLDSVIEMRETKKNEGDHRSIGP